MVKRYRYWVAISLTCILQLGMNSVCRAEGASAGVGISAGEPLVGISLWAFGPAGNYEMNVGWSSRRDGGIDLNATAMFYEGAYRESNRVLWSWDVLGGPRVTFFDNTEYGIMVPARFSCVVRGAERNHWIHVDAGPSIAVSPHTTTTLYAIVGYRFYK